MPNFETPDDLADHLADLLGIYEDPRCGVDELALCYCGNPLADTVADRNFDDEEIGAHCHLDDEPGFPPHLDGCDCRVNWVPRMAQRIRSAVATEKFLYPLTERALTSGADVSPPRRAEATRALPARDWSSEKEGHQVPPAMWGCRKHWYKLPRAIRRRIWAAFEPGQEEAMSPSPKYLAAAKEAQDWIRGSTAAVELFTPPATPSEVDARQQPTQNGGAIEEG